MRHQIVIRLALVLFILMSASRTFAHHGFSAYDMTKMIALKATITEFQWTNPHSIVSFTVKDDKGKVTEWSVETGHPRALMGLGWNKQSLKPGDQVTIYLHPAKNGNPVGALEKVVFPDGHEVSGRTPDK